MLCLKNGCEDGVFQMPFEFPLRESFDLLIFTVSQRKDLLQTIFCAWAVRDVARNLKKRKKRKKKYFATYCSLLENVKFTLKW